MTHRATEIREQLHTEVERMLSDVVKWKINLQTQLENYEEFVQQSVDQEAAEAQNAREGSAMDDAMHDAMEVDS